MIKQFILTWTVGLLVIGGIMFLAFPAMAQQQMQCAPYQQMARFLSEKYGERPNWYGNLGDGVAFLTQSDDGKTWTLLVSHGRQLCIFATGKDGQFYKPKPAGEPT